MHREHNPTRTRTQRRRAAELQCTLRDCLIEYARYALAIGKPLTLRFYDDTARGPCGLRRFPGDDPDRLRAFLERSDIWGVWFTLPDNRDRDVPFDETLPIAELKCIRSTLRRMTHEANARPQRLH